MFGNCIEKNNYYSNSFVVTVHRFINRVVVIMLPIIDATNRITSTTSATIKPVNNNNEDDRTSELVEDDAEQ